MSLVKQSKHPGGELFLVGNWGCRDPERGAIKLNAHTSSRRPCFFPLRWQDLTTGLVGILTRDVKGSSVFRIGRLKESFCRIRSFDRFCAAQTLWIPLKICNFAPRNTAAIRLEYLAAQSNTTSRGLNASLLLVH